MSIRRRWLYAALVVIAAATCGVIGFIERLSGHGDVPFLSVPTMAASVFLVGGALLWAHNGDFGGRMGDSLQSSSLS